MAYERQFTVNATVISSGLGTAQTGTDQVCVLFEYQDEQGNVHRINWYGHFTDAAAKYADEALKNIGWDPAANSWDYFVLNGDDSPIVGKKARLVLDWEDDGERGERLRVRFVNSAGGGLGLKERMTPEAAQAFAARRRAAAGGAVVSAPRPKPAAASAPGPAAPAAARPAPARPAAAARPAPASHTPQVDPAKGAFANPTQAQRNAVAAGGPGFEDDIPF